MCEDVCCITLSASYHVTISGTGSINLEKRTESSINHIFMFHVLQQLLVITIVHISKGIVMKIHNGWTE